MPTATKPVGWGPRHGRRSGARGQALVELALLASLLLVLALGVADFGRVLGTNATIENAAREAVRQETNFEFLNGTEGSDPLGRAKTAAENELGCSNCLARQDSLKSACGSSIGAPKPPYDPGNALPSSDYPTGTDTGFIWSCSWKSSNDSKQHFEVIITWRASLFTPLMQNIVGQPQLHGIADGTEP